LRQDNRVVNIRYRSLPGRAGRRARDDARASRAPIADRPQAFQLPLGQTEESEKNDLAPGRYRAEFDLRVEAGQQAAVFDPPPPAIAHF
jgi:hypothetical protein